MCIRDRDGSAAMAVIAPIWNIIYSFGLWCGIGGSVIYAVARGERDDVKEANGYFTSAFILGVLWAERFVYIELFILHPDKLWHP